MAALLHRDSGEDALRKIEVILQILTIAVSIGMFLAALFLIPVIRKVDRSTQKVFELFAEIPQDKVKMLMDNCE